MSYGLYEIEIYDLHTVQTFPKGIALLQHEHGKNISKLS